ncbi:MAG: VCBS repeat-containing protein [Acidobacteriota bacterium]
MNDQRSARICSVYLSLTLALATVAGADPDVQAGFPAPLNGDRVREGSIALGDVTGNGNLDIVIGTGDGNVHALDGNGNQLWRFVSGMMSVNSKPAIANIDTDPEAEIIVTFADPRRPESANGGLMILDHQGNMQCQYTTNDSDSSGFRDGIYGSPAIADLDGNDGGLMEIAFSAWDRLIRVINHDCTLVWFRNVVDTSWSSPAIGDIDRDGILDVVVGVASDSMPGNNGEEDGGLLFAFSGINGENVPGFPVQIDETIQSSPALGDIDGDGFLEIMVGTGRCWSNPACAPGGRVNPGVGEYLNAFEHDGQYVPGWPVAVPGTYSFSSPALGDLDGDGLPEVVFNTVDPDANEDGRIYALDADGTALPGWPLQPQIPTADPNVFRQPETSASPIMADLTGDGFPEVILPSSFELAMFDRNGNQLSRSVLPPDPNEFQLVSNFVLASAAAVGDIDGDGDLELVAGGANAGGAQGTVYAWDFPAAADEEAWWPTFRRSSTNTAAITGLIFANGFESGDTSGWNS